MKKIMAIAVILASFGGGSAFSEEKKENSVDLGLGAYYRNSVYKKENHDEVLPVPMGGVRIGNFYFEAPLEAGYHFFKTENLTLTAYGRYNIYTGYDPDDMIDEFKDMDKRGDDFHIGLREKYNFGPLRTGIVSRISGDISGKSDGLLARVEINQPVPLRKNVIILPYVAFEYMNDSYVDYYFGISREEAEKGINNGRKYDGDDVFNLEAGITGVIQINESFKILANGNYKRYGDSISDSPLVEDRDIYTAGVGIIYSFKF